MAVINRIEIANFLCEGWQPRKPWVPLYPASTLRLCGQSTAIQILNGSGKTSLAIAVLFLLSRDRTLKKAFIDRCAPVDMGYTHIRIEFVFPSEDIVQRELITVRPDEVPGRTYVIGVCANNGDADPVFYRYPGLLEDVPTYFSDDKGITFIANAAFRTRFNALPKGDWNKWASAGEWRKVIREFLSVESVRQNVTFQRGGAGDASAALTKVVQAPGERFDEAFFKQIVAPQLLANVMGDSAEEDERAIEDTIVISMTRFIDAKLDVERKSERLVRRQAMEEAFKPVLDAARDIALNDRTYSSHLQALRCSAALLQRFTIGSQAMPGVPKAPEASRASGEVKALLAGMAVDKDGTVVVADDALAAALNLSTGHLNRDAEQTNAVRTPVSPTATSSQLIDLSMDIKIVEGAGGRRKQVRHYRKDAALELAKRRIEAAPNGIDVVTRAFEVAESELETNPFRRSARRLVDQRESTLRQIDSEIEAKDRAERDIEALESQRKERKENETAYEEFCANVQLLPEQFRLSPIDAEHWLRDETARRDGALTAHSQRVGECKVGWAQYQQLRDQHGLVSLPDALAELHKEKASVDAARNDARVAKSIADRNFRDLVDRRAEISRECQEAAQQLSKLREHHPRFEAYRALFGDVDPIANPPPVQDRDAAERKLKRTCGERDRKQRERDELGTLSVAMTLFRRLFGEADPASVDPLGQRDSLVERNSAAQIMLGEHQPLAEAIEEHLSCYGVPPAQWLADADDRRHRASIAVSTAVDEASRLQRSLDALDDLRLVDDEHIERVHAALADAGIPFERLRDVILTHQPDKSKQIQQLAAFGAFVGAPVLRNMSDVEAAFAALAHVELQIPLILRAPLLAALREAAHDVAHAGAVAFMVGPTTRRIRAMVDPTALAEEKAHLALRIKEQQVIRSEAEAIVANFGPATDGYRRALKAREAEQRNSLAHARQARDDLAELGQLLTAAEALCTTEALGALADARKFIAMGGNNAIVELDTGLTTLRASVAAIETELARLVPLTTPEAVLAHDGAVAFTRAGGETRMAEVAHAVERLSKQLAGIENEREELKSRLTQLEQAQNEATAAAEAFHADFQLKDVALRQAIEFESNGSAAFMQQERKLREALEAQRDELRPLTRIAFERAQRYADLRDKSDTDLDKAVGEAKGRRDQARQRAQKLQKDAEKAEGLILAMKAVAEALHELATLLAARWRSVAPYQNDLVGLEGVETPAEAHDAFKTLEALRHRLLDWKEADGPLDHTALMHVRNEIEEINVDRAGDDLKQARQRLTQAREQFASRRQNFCTRAVTADQGAMSQAEIDAILAAETLDELIQLSQLGERLRQDLAQEKAELEGLRALAETVEAHSIETLTRLVDSCRDNLATLESVMARNANARFFLHAKVIGDEDIKKLMLELRDGIERRKRDAQDRTQLGRRRRDDDSIKSDIRHALIDRVFLEPEVEFRHVGIWDGARRPLSPALSEGQKAALQMMWLIKESEYHLECEIRRHLGAGSKKAMRNREQRLLLFDGLFSNLSDRGLINEAFKGLGDAGSNLQLIGLIHNPEYKNNFRIFPTYIVGRRAGWSRAAGQSSFVAFDDRRADGSMGTAHFIVKQPAEPAHAATGR